MDIRCGHCKGRHDSIDEVFECWSYEAQPQEVCCGCDALKGYASTPEEVQRLSRQGCSCDGLQGQVRPRTIEEIRAEHKHFKCNCPPEYSMCKMVVIYQSELGRLDGTRNGTNGGVGHGGWSGYGNQLEKV